MTSRMRWLFSAGLVAIGAAVAGGWYLRHASPPVPPPPPRVVQTHPPKPRLSFNGEQFRQFLQAARQAESIADPLQRCLAYPEPPGVHWSKDVTTAYCHYQFDPAVTLADARHLIEHGQATELEHRLSEARDAQLSQSGMQSLLDRTYNIDFAEGSDDLRALLDAWKRQSPDNPYALAASGTAYVAMAQKQRGSDYVSKTSQSALESMSRLLQQARDDLDRAAALDPKMTPAYTAMLYAAALQGDDAYAMNAARRALAVDPSNYPVYARMVWMSQPKWGGTVPQMQGIIKDAQQHAAQNPLLRLLLSERTGGEAAVEDCTCNPATEQDLYRTLFDEAAPVGMLMSAGWASRNRNARPLSVVYRSELLRFVPGNLSHRESRAFDLAEIVQADWALDEGNALIKLAPQDETAFDVRAVAYRAKGDATHAVADFEQALRLNPADTWTLGILGDFYVQELHDWDNGWRMASRLIQVSPDNPEGWFLRATIQKQQPREGLDQTIADFAARFGSDPRKQALVAHMQAMKQP